jgi:hypothetical protein
VLKKLNYLSGYGNPIERSGVAAALDSYSEGAWFESRPEHRVSLLKKSSTFWDITPCGPLKVNSACYMFHAGFLLGLFVDPEDGGDMFVRNFG